MGVVVGGGGLRVRGARLVQRSGTRQAGKHGGRQIIGRQPQTDKHLLCHSRGGRWRGYEGGG